MKKVIVIAAMALSGATFAIAQQQVQKTRMTRAEANEKAVVRAQVTTDRMEKELQLTPAQKAEIHKLILENNQNRVNQRMDAMEAAQKNNQAIKAVLTPEQQNLLKQHQQEKMMKRSAQFEMRQKDLKQAPAVQKIVE